MIWGEYLARLQRQVSRTDIGTDEYTDYAQRALKKIQQRRSWTCMKQSGQVIMPAGAITVPLPANFKELQTGDSPIRVLFTAYPDSATRPLPCKIYPKREFERLYASFSYGALSSYYWRGPYIGFPVFIDTSAEVWTLNIGFQSGNSTGPSPMTFLIDYYGFLPTPENENDTNYFLENYEEMVMAKAKAICFEAINDDFAGEWETVFAREFKECVADDAFRQVRGVALRM